MTPSRQLQDDDPLLSTRACADWMGRSTESIRMAIRRNLLEAEYVQAPGCTRGVHAIRLSKFQAYLKRVGFKRLPTAAFR